MKPKIDDKKCSASRSGCKVLKACPVEAISYIEVDEPILNKNLVCDCTSSEDDGVTCGCDCGEDCGNNLYGCGEIPSGRIIIDYDKCTGCGVCVKECCGTAIGMV